MNLRSKLVLGVASIALVSGLSVAAQAQVADPAPAGPMTTPAPTAGQPLTDVQNANKTLVGAKVQDSKGEAVGEVRAVKLGPDGKVASVDVKIGNKTVALQANSLTYAQANNTLTSAQTKAEIQATP
ncbi:MAG: PRC-barrel domain-containing protein [Alphaproteobacteria bacterium]|jgi:sporulation protein YlmC with PRC-barrel domain|nr:PRC-barrel domain-containing protein [Alphaproteobacteria bacterium]